MKLAPKQEMCATKRDLLAAYKAATKSYADSIAELAEKIDIISKGDYVNLSIAAQNARRLSASALETLEAHTDEHGC